MKAEVPGRDFGDRVGVLVDIGKTASSASESRRCCGFGGPKGSSTIRAEAPFRVGPIARWEDAVKTQTSDERRVIRCLGSLAFSDEASMLLERVA